MKVVTFEVGMNDMPRLFLMSIDSKGILWYFKYTMLTAFLAVIIIREYSSYFPGLDYFSKRQVVVCDDWVNTLAGTKKITYNKRRRDLEKTKRPVMKPLSELTLLDRFLFACAMEDASMMQLILQIILGKEIGFIRH